MERVRLALQQRWWWALGSAFVLVVWALGALQKLDLLTYDYLVPRLDAPARSLIVAVDEASLAALGRWPWPREQHARLLDRLREAQAAGVGFALLFSEASDDAAQDRLLAQALAAFQPVALPVAPVLGRESADKGPGLVELRPLPMFERTVRLGHVDMEVDADGAVRRLYLYAGMGRPRYPAMSLALADRLEQAVLSGERTDSGPGRLLPGTWVRDEAVMLPRLVRELPVWSFVDALSSPAFLAAAKGRVVWVGVTAAGLGTELYSPSLATRRPVPVVQLHAAAYEARLAQALVVPWSAGPGLALSLALLCLPWGWGRPTGPLVVLAAAATLALPWLLSWGLLHTRGEWWEPSLASVGLAAVFVAWLASGNLAATQRLARDRRAAQATLEAIGDAVIEIDPEGRVAYMNPAGRRLIPGPVDRQRPWQQVLPFETESLARLEDAFERALAQGAAVQLPAPLWLKPGLSAALDHEPKALRTTVSPRRSPAGQAEGAVFALGDVSEVVAAAKRLDHAATHDALTGLPNRRLLQDRLQQALQRALRGGHLVAVLFIDLDRFKRINDSLGHGVGDQVLRASAQRLREACRAQDTVARWGGDEFVVLLENVVGRDALAPLAAKVVQAMAEPLPIQDLELPSQASLGIALFPLDGADADQVLAHADAAMYRAKASGGGRFEFFSGELSGWTRERLTLENDLRLALRAQSMELHYQPQVHAMEGHLVGFEALVRWRRSAAELVWPVDFLPMAEDSGLIVDLGAWVLDEALRQLAAWSQAGLKLVPVSVNVSARQCMNWRIVDVLRELLDKHQVSAHWLKLEITETIAMTDVEHVAALFIELRALGVHLSVDDFGTGYSSLSHLRRFPLSEIKIDRGFVQGMLNVPDDAAIVRATIALAHELGLPVVAEGVETQAQCDFLRARGCDVLQGFLTGRPQRADEVQGLLAAG